MQNNSVSTVTGKIKIKIVFLGNQAVGKSSIIQKYVNDRFDQTAHPTVGIDFLAKNILYKNKSYRLQLWDTAGQERFKCLIPGYLRDSHCSLIVFDISSKTSLNNTQNWLNLYNEHKNTEGFTLLIGNKIDLVDAREVTEQQAKAKAKQLGIIYYEVSAKSGQNLQQLFSNIVQICTQKSLQGANFNFKAPKKQQNAIIQQQNEDKQQKKQSKQNTQQLGLRDNVIKLSKPTETKDKDNLNKSKKQNCCK